MSDFLLEILILLKIHKKIGLIFGIIANSYSNIAIIYLDSCIFKIILKKIHTEAYPIYDLDL